MTIRVTFAALTVALAGCAAEDHSWRYGQKSDTRPHPGAASASRYAIQGIDISRWQGTIDWRSVRAAGTRFVFMKATEGGDHIDPRFRENWNGARAAGIPTGAYHFVYWCRPAHEQAQWFVQHIPSSRDSLSLPPILDVEWNGHSRTCPRKVSRDVALEKMRVMLRELEAHTGKKPIIYTDVSFHRDVLEGVTEFDGYPYWIRSTAAPPHEKYPGRRWAFWQFTTTGRVPGITGNVDRNVFYGSESEFQGWLQGTYDIALRQGFGGRTPVAQPAPAAAPSALQPAPQPAPTPPAIPAQSQAPAPVAQPQPAQRPQPVEEEPPTEGEPLPSLRQ